MSSTINVSGALESLRPVPVSHGGKASAVKPVNSLEMPQDALFQPTRTAYRGNRKELPMAVQDYLMQVKGYSDALSSSLTSLMQNAPDTSAGGAGNAAAVGAAASAGSRQSQPQSRPDDSGSLKAAAGNAAGAVLGAGAAEAWPVYNAEAQAAEREEAERLEEQREKRRLEEERLEDEREEKRLEEERLEAEKAEDEQLAAEEADRLESDAAEAARLEVPEADAAESEAAAEAAEINALSGENGGASASRDSAQNGVNAGQVRDSLGNLVNSYNSLLEFSRDNSKDPGFERLNSRMAALSGAYSATLGEAGIDVRDDGSLEIDSQRIDRAISDGSVGRLFAEPGEEGGAQGASFARGLASVAERAQSKPFSYMNDSAPRRAGGESGNGREYLRIINERSGMGLMFEAAQ